jgi:P27 family predicted phage terminase small subunit
VQADELANEEWNRIVPLLDSVKVLTEPDLHALANYCLSASVSIRSAIEVTKYPLVSEESGRVNPHIKIAKEARQECLRFAIEFGLTPAARSRIVGQPKDGDAKDGDEDFLFHPPKLVVNAK